MEEKTKYILPVVIFVALVFLVSGVIVETKHEHKNASREKQTIDYLKEAFLDERIAEARAALKLFAVKHREQMEEVQAKKHHREREIAAHSLRRTFTRMLQHQPWIKSWNEAQSDSTDYQVTALLFYDEIAKCVDSKQCQPKIACRFFEQDVRDLRALMDRTANSSYRSRQKQFLATCQKFE